MSMSITNGGSGTTMTVIIPTTATGTSSDR